MWPAAVTAGFHSTASSGLRACLAQKRASEPAPRPSMPMASSWRFQEQQPGHHLAGVFQHQLGRVLDAHGALHPFGIEMEVAHAIRFGKRGLVEF